MHYVDRDADEDRTPTEVSSAKDRVLCRHAMTGEERRAGLIAISPAQ